MPDPRATARQIAELEASYCNPRKLKEARELRDDLHNEGYSDADIDALVDDPCGERE